MVNIFWIEGGNKFNFIILESIYFKIYVIVKCVFLVDE